VSDTQSSTGTKEITGNSHDVSHFGDLTMPSEVNQTGDHDQNIKSVVVASPDLSFLPPSVSTTFNGRAESRLTEMTK